MKYPILLPSALISLLRASRIAGGRMPEDKAGDPASSEKEVKNC